MSIFGPQGPQPTRINQVQINQSVLGYCIPVVMGRGKVQQSILWADGFSSKKINTSGGKGFGGGKGGNQYLYSADVIAALCNGGGSIIGIGDVWSGQSWLQNQSASESYTIPASPGGGGGINPRYTPINATAMTADAGAGFLVTYSGSYNDVGSTTPTLTSGSDLSPLSRVPYIGSTVLASGEYMIDDQNNYYFSYADQGKGVQLSYSFSLKVISKDEIDLIPAGLVIQVGDNSGNNPFAQDGGVTYYSTDSNNPNNGVPLTFVPGTPTQTGTYTVSGSSPATYKFAPGDLGQEVKITYKLNDSATLPTGEPTTLNFTLFEGQMFQAVWPLLTSNFPGEAVGYTGIALVAYGPMDLGYGAQIQQNVFEVLTADGWGAGIADCNVVQCVLQVLTNSVWGLGAGAVPFPVSAIDNGASGTWGGGNNSTVIQTAQQTIQNWRTLGQAQVDTTASSWFAANNFFISPVIDHQDTAASVIGMWLEAGQCAAFMSEGLLKLVPYGDTSTSSNGKTWTAPQAYAAILDDSCFLPKGKGQDPVTISSSPWQDAFNTVQVSWKNRSSQYAPETTPESDQAAINRYGSRIEDPQNWDFITTLAAAQFAASMRVKRNVYTRNTYEFNLPYRYTYLECMDVVQITTSSSWAPAALNSNLAVVSLPVRITKIVDNPDGTLNLTAEDYPFGIHAPFASKKIIAKPIPLAQQMNDPGNTQAIVFEATSRLTGFHGDQIWIGAAGASADWGGCNVLASMDGNTYKTIGTVEAPARMGTLAAALPSGSDPDTTDTMVINLVTNSSPLEAGTTADADQNNTLCYVDGELIAYSAAAISGQDQYTAGTYLRRGQMGSTIGAHAAGANFLRLDDAVLQYTYDPTWYGKTVYLKFQSFNTYGNAAQDPSTLTAVTFTVPGQNPGAFDAATGIAFNPATPTQIQTFVNSGRLQPGAYGGATYVRQS